VHSESIPLEEHQRVVDDLEVQLEAAEREIGRLELAIKDTGSVDISLEDPACSREALQAALEKVNNELSGLKKLWTAERQSLMGEKVMLKDASNKLAAEVKAKSAKVEQEHRRAKEAAKYIQDEGERQKAIMQAVSNVMPCLYWCMPNRS